ncbi:MAG: transporter ATP-binding/permease protein, partial [Bacteroidota bacterium]|nr:transporter ATP-binding/permease protein [Bacteroidota bacterium]
NQALSGKLVFANIHQPSSDILKLFDRLWLLDKGGYMIYDGDPVEALVYFKTETSQANAAESECPSCGNIETDDILHIIEVKVIDNNGLPGKERQVTPQEWYERYRKKMMPVLTEKPQKTPVAISNFKVPQKSDQIRTFISRNIIRKLADKQYMVINLLEAPLLALILGYISKYSENGVYLFSTNKNYWVFLFMAVIVALFIGLTVSAEEIYRDRKILEREKFLNLSRLSYLISKVNFLFTLSAIQTLTFVIVANLVLGVRGMLLQQWLILFSTACFGNMLGLNISAGMRSVVSIYILVPLILVPQLLLGGAMIKFDELPRSFSRKIYVPVIGDIMATRWAYEAISVEQFKSNRYEKPLFNYAMEKSRNDWFATFLIPELKAKTDQCIRWGKDPDYREFSENNFVKLNYHLNQLAEVSGISPGKWISSVNYSGFNDIIADDTKLYFDSLKTVFRKSSRILSDRLDSIHGEKKKLMGEDQYLRMRDRDYNENLANIVLNRYSTSQKFDAEDRIVQKADPIFMAPDSKWGRAHFYAPYKLLGKLKISTLLFNVAAIWIMIIGLFVTLYYNLLKRLILWLESLKVPIWRKFGREFLQI